MSQSAIREFLGQKKLAFIGLSRFSGKFSRTVYSMLKERGYTLYPINPHADRIGDEKCYRSFEELPEKVDGAVLMVPSFKAA